MTAIVSAQAYKVPRTASGQPDLNGFWQALNTANWDLEAHEAAAGPVLQLGAAYAVPPGPGVVIDGPIHVRFLDRAGNYHTDGLHVVERIRRTDADHLSYQATIEDPNVYTRPWTISMPLYRRVEPKMQLGEFKCEEFVGDLLYGKYQRK